MSSKKQSHMTMKMSRQKSQERDLAYKRAGIRLPCLRNACASDVDTPYSGTFTDAEGRRDIFGVGIGQVAVIFTFQWHVGLSSADPCNS